MSPDQFSQLLTEVRNCQLCRQQLPLPPKPILQASNKSKILIAGQAPGKVTHDKGIAFDDKSGDRLRTWLGIDRASFYNASNFAIIPMSFCYPGTNKKGGKSGDLPPLPICAQTWRQKLLVQLPELTLTLIIGKYAFDWHKKQLIKQNPNHPITTVNNLTHACQQWQQLLEHKLLVLPHPSPRNNLWLKRNAWFETEVLPILRQQVKNLLNC